VAIRITVEDIAFFPFSGLTNACAIIVGNAIGSGHQEKAQGYVRQALTINLVMGLSIGALIFFSRGLILSYFNITETTRRLAMNILVVVAGVMWMRSSNFIFFIGMMRAGGDTRFAWMMDVISLWGIGVPLALTGAFVLRLPVYYVYLLVMVEEALKFVVSIFRYRSKRWIHNLVIT
jgi:Na+-driven multidrug efflux pump